MEWNGRLGDAVVALGPDLRNFEYLEPSLHSVHGHEPRTGQPPVAIANSALGVPGRVRR